MIQRIHLLFILLCLGHSPANFCMEMQEKSAMDVIRYQVKVPLKFGRLTKQVQKSVLVKVPDTISAGLQDARNQAAKTVSARSSNATLQLERFRSETQKEMQEVLNVFISLMLNNDNGQVTPELGELAHIDTELFALLQLPQAYFAFKRDERQLLLCWDLGGDTNWSFNKVIHVYHKPELPRKGARSPLMVQYHNNVEHVHGQVPLSELRELYAVAGKKTIIGSTDIRELVKDTTLDINQLQAKEVIEMAQWYVANLKNLQNQAK